MGCAYSLIVTATEGRRRTKEKPMTYLKLDHTHQTKIARFAERNQAFAHASLAKFAARYPGSPQNMRVAVRSQLGNVAFDRPLSAKWFGILSDWGATLPSMSITTAPPKPAVGDIATRVVVRWMPGAVSAMTAPDGRVLWKSAELCPKLGLKANHVQKHKGTLEDEDFEVLAEGRRQDVWVTKRGMLKLIVRSRDAGVKGTFLNLLLNQIIDVYVDFVDTGVVIHPNADLALMQRKIAYAASIQSPPRLSVGAPSDAAYGATLPPTTGPEADAVYEPGLTLENSRGSPDEDTSPETPDSLRSAEP